MRNDDFALSPQLIIFKLLFMKCCESFKSLNIYEWVFLADSPKRWFLLHYATFCLSFAGILFLVLARGHYSIDVVVAYWITTRLWYIYHTMTNNGQLLKDSRNSRNYFRKMWWWYMFYYFECNVPVTVPREYNLPIPNRVLRLKPIAWISILCTRSGCSLAFFSSLLFQSGVSP